MRIWQAVFIWVSVFLFTYLFILQVPGVVSKRYLLYAMLIGLAAALLFWTLLMFKEKRTAEDGWHSLQKHLLPVLVYTIAFLPIIQSSIKLFTCSNRQGAD